LAPLLGKSGVGTVHGELGPCDRALGPRGKSKAAQSKTWRMVGPPNQRASVLDCGGATPLSARECTSDSDSSWRASFRFLRMHWGREARFCLTLTLRSSMKDRIKSKKSSAKSETFAQKKNPLKERTETSLPAEKINLYLAPASLRELPGMKLCRSSTGFFMSSSPNL